MLDTMATLMRLASLKLIPVGIYSMINASVVVFTALLAMVFVGRKQYGHHWIGTTLIVAGVIIVGYVAVYFGDPT